MTTFAIKACHPLGNWKSNIPHPAVIVKFTYYNNKVELYNRRPKLAKFRNPLIGKPVYTKERLPNMIWQFKSGLTNWIWSTPTYNCRVKLFLKTQNKRLTLPVDSVKAVEDLESRAIKKISPYQRNQATNWKPNQVPNQRRNKRPGEVIEIDNFDEIYHMGATPAGKKLNGNDTPPNR